MSKPTIFFSHSSKDKEIVLKIKNKLMKFTSNTIEIFQSSDGESIPFGTNWIHKVEDGLKNSKVMFVFITENSISSGWIYFEAGFAYSKGIHVIPVGLGINVGDLKAPLNLLQGYNITSEDGLNNFLTIINREFSYDFDSQFTRTDYDEVISLLTDSNITSGRFDEVIKSIKYTFEGTYYNAPGNKITRECNSVFENIKNYLNEHSVEYSLTPIHGYGQDKGSCIAARGIKITYELSSKAEDSGNIHISISPYNFKHSFELFLQLMLECVKEDDAWLQLRLKEGLKYITADEDCAALLTENSELFSLSKSQVGSFDCNKWDLHFGIYNNGDHRTSDYVLGIGYNPSNITSENIINLVNKLYELNIIYGIGDKTHG